MSKPGSRKYRKDVELLKEVQMEMVQEGHEEMIKGLEHLLYEARFREQGLFSLEKAPMRPHCGLLVHEGSLQARGKLSFYTV